MKLKTIFAMLLGCFFLSSAFAMPMTADTAAQPAIEAIEKIDIVCDPWGNCWDRHWEHEEEEAWRHWQHDQRRAWRHWEHDVEHAYKHGWDDWDGRDWHGGRWGEW